MTGVQTCALPIWTVESFAAEDGTLKESAGWTSIFIYPGYRFKVLDALVKAFITPIEREDIILLSQNIDEVTDKIEDVMLRLYYNNIQSIRPDSLELVSIVVKSCDMVKLMLKEFASFRHSKSLRDHIIAINTLEEQADQVFVTSMRELHTTCTDPVEIICWREVYFYLEKCTDACEHVADVVEQIVMKNS